MASIVDLLEDRATETYTPYVFLEDGDDDERSITAAALAIRARAIAATLAGVAKRGDRVLILVPPGLDYIAAFFGCLYAGVIAVPAYPPDPRRLARTLPRLLAIVEAASATVMLTTRALHAAAAALVPSLHAVALDDASGDLRSDGDGVAMLQFTSGSTTTPRGVILTHDCILANLAAIKQTFELAPDERVVSWLPPYHDMGIGAILAPLHSGGQLIAMSPLHFLQRPARWLRAITKYRAQVSGGPNFAYDLCVRKVDLATEQLDLSTWSLAFDGAEVVRAATLDAFTAKFGAVGFRRSAFVPCYGLAEATLLVTAVRRADEPAIRDDDGIARVSCGRPAPGVEVTIVEGEICVAGPSVGRGYWGQGAFESPLRTGDLGELHAGELYVTGRLKDLIIFSGRKLSPDDIERVVAAAHPALRPGCTVAFAADIDGAERLVIVQEVEPDHDAAVRAAITRAVVESFDVAPHAIVLLPPGELPKTSSGKVQRHACKDAWSTGQMRGE